MKAEQASGGKGRPQAAAGDAPAWQGMRTKGAEKVAGGQAARERGTPGGAAAARESRSKRKALGKRPAVASRKAQLQKQPGRARQQEKRK